jgi:hypothetical protein
MARVSRAQLRKIAPRGKKGLRDTVTALRASFPTDDFLAVLNADLPDMSSDDAITAWVEQERWRFGDTIQAMGRVGGIPEPPAWMYGTQGVRLFLGCLICAQLVARLVADTIISSGRLPDFREPCAPWRNSTTRSSAPGPGRQKR